VYEIGIILALVFCNAIFVASEFATIAAPRMAIEKRANDGDVAAKMVLSVLKEPFLQDRYIAASQVGITAASLGLGMYGEHVIAEWLVAHVHATALVDVAASHVIASALSVVALTYLHIVLGEMIPKSLALQRSKATMLLLAWPMYCFMTLFWPIIEVLNSLNNIILKRFLGIDRSRSSMAIFSPEEIQMIVKESETEGIISDEIGIVIEQMFDFGELTAQDIMVPRVHMTALPMRPNSTELRKLLEQRAHTRYPVYGVDKDDIVGIVHIKDLAVLVESGSERPLPIRTVPFVALSASLDIVLQEMRKQSTQIAIVLDEHGGTAGMVTLQDIFEELIGEIDESFTQPSIVPLEDGAFRVRGTVRLTELADHIFLSAEEQDVTTISGLVLDQLQRPPKEGDRFDYGPISVEVIKVKGRGATLCVVRRRHQRDNEEKA
jgi:CBS domain containing-hemolysin-like protein